MKEYSRKLPLEWSWGDGGDRDLSQSGKNLGMSLSLSVGVRSRALRPATFELSRSVYAAEMSV